MVYIWPSLTVFLTYTTELGYPINVTLSLTCPPLTNTKELKYNLTRFRLYNQIDFDSY